MKEKFKALKDAMERYDIFQHDDEVGMALKELELEIDSLEKFTLYREDFSQNSEEHKLLFNNGLLSTQTIFYKK